MLPAIRSELEFLCNGPIPDRWVQLISNYPDELRFALRSDDGSEDEGHVSDAELLADPADLLAINREVRSSNILDPANRPFSWPVRCLVIGETGDGDYYCLNADDPACGVIQFMHLPVRFKRLTTDLEGFLEMLFSAYVDADEDGEDEADDDEDEDDLEDDGEEGVNADDDAEDGEPAAAMA